MKKLAPAIFLTCAILPLFAGLLYALLYSLGMTGALGTGFTLDAWQNVLTDRTFWISLGLSALIALVVVMISTVLALWLLVWLRPGLERPGVRRMLHFPLAIPPIVAAFISFQWLGSSGMVARAAMQVGWIDDATGFPPLINDPMYLGVILTLTLTTFPFLLLLFLQYYQATNLLQMSSLAATLGANSNQIKRFVVAPVLLRRAAPTLLLYGVFLFGVYEVPLLLGRQNPAMISVLISQKFSRYNLADIPVAYTAAVIYALLAMLLVVFFLRMSRSNDPGMSA